MIAIGIREPARGSPESRRRSRARGGPAGSRGIASGNKKEEGAAAMEPAGGLLCAACT